MTLEVKTASGEGLSPQANAEWDDFVGRSACGHLMQSSAWGALKGRFGWDVERVVIRDDGRIAGGAQVLYRSLPLGMGRLAYVPMGPVVDWSDADMVTRLLSALRDTVNRRRAFCLKLEPAALHGGAITGKTTAGYRPSPQTVQWRRTIVIDLDCTEEELMARLDKKHRQKVRKADRAGVTVREGTAADVPIFVALLDQTAARKEFAAYPPEYYRASFELLGADGRGRLLLATYENEVLAGLMVFMLGDTAYCMFAASGDAHRDLMPTYLLHWEGIRSARECGCRRYDYCGIPDEVDPGLHAHEQRHDGLWGVYRFKRGFGGQVVSYPASIDEVYNRGWYALYNRAIGVLQSGLGATWNRRLFSG